MSNTNTNLQTQTSNAHHNAIMEAGGKDHPPMLAPEGSSETTIEGYMENYKNVSQDIRNQLDVEAEAVQIILTRINNDIYSIVDASPNALNVTFLIQLQPEWKRFVTLVKQSQELNAVSYHKLYDILKQHQNEVNEIRAKRLARTANPLALVAQQQPVYHPQNHPNHYNQNSSTRSQQAVTRNRGKAIVNSPPCTYDHEPTMVAEDDEMSKEKETDKLMALISLSFKKIYKPTNNNLRTSSNTSRANQDNTLRINKGTGDDTNDEPNDQELEAHYLYMAKIQEVTPDAANNSGSIFDTKPLQKVQNDNDKYNVFSNGREHLEQPESVNDTYIEEQEANNEMSKTKQLMFKDIKKFQAELDRYHDVNYVSKVETDYAKAKGCYNDNLALMLAPESDETIRLAHEIRSKLSDLIKPFDYKNLNNLYDLSKMPMVVPIRTREPKRTMNQYAATPLMRTVAAESTNQKPRSTIRKQYEHISKTYRWWYCKIMPPGYKWKPKSRTVNVEPNLVEIILFIADSGCSKHMTGNLKLLSNFMEQFMGMVKFGNDQNETILGYGDLVQGNVTIKRVYYVEGLDHNLFSVGQLCHADLEVTFRKSTCYIRDLKGNNLLIGSHGTDLYSITLQNTSTPNLICLMAKATSSEAWLWHRRLSHPNFDTINLLSKYDIVTGLPKLKFVKDHIFSSCELGKAKYKSFKTKNTPSSKRRLQILHMDLCGPMRVESFNGKKYVLVIVDDYSRYTWTHFLRSKDETPEVLIDFLKLFQRGLHAQVRTVRTDKDTEFLNKTLHAYFAQEGIEHQTSSA
ncbi:retrovirus-related pol polyprotein from transposon TNT 1-94 [Tanacetum coccineum]